MCGVWLCVCVWCVGESRVAAGTSLADKTAGLSAAVRRPSRTQASPAARRQRHAHRQQRVPTHKAHSAAAGCCAIIRLHCWHDAAAWPRRASCLPAAARHAAAAAACHAAAAAAAAFCKISRTTALAPPGAQQLPVGRLQRGAGQHRWLARGQVPLYHIGQLLQPGPAVVVAQRRARLQWGWAGRVESDCRIPNSVATAAEAAAAVPRPGAAATACPQLATQPLSASLHLHLCDIGGRVEAVALVKGRPKRMRQQGRHRAEAGTRAVGGGSVDGR